jgi:hypothetical protein
VSFCNMGPSPAREACVAFVDLDTRAVEWLPVSSDRHSGGRALCKYKEYICVAYVSRGRGVFALLDRSNGAVVSEGLAPRGVHSAVAHGDALYFVATQQDSVYRAVPSGKEWRTEHYWTLPGSSGTEDENHLNGITLVRGEIWVSGMGPKKDESISPTDGFLYNVSRERMIHQGILHPHSLLYDGKEVWTCTSWNAKVISLKGHSYHFPVTYLRGLGMDETYLYGGSSKLRLYSLSTGAKNTGVSREMRGECSVWRVAREGGTPERIVDFTTRRDEIYDVLPIS